MESNKNSFEYTYSATQQEEIEKIRNKYLPKEETKLDELRRLDASVTRLGTIWGLVVGIVGILVFGAGLSMVLVVGSTLLLPGILLGVLGLALMGVAYPLYKNITDRERERIAPQILALTEELGK